MPEYEVLDEKKEKQLHILETFQRKKSEFQIRTALREAVLRLDSVISPLLDIKDRKDALLLSRFSKLSSIAFRQLAKLPGAVRFCELRIEKALEIIGGT